MGNGFNKFMQDHHAGSATGNSSTPTIPNPVPPSLPPVPKFQPPAFYAPQQSQLQRAVPNPESTSHNNLQRFGVARQF